MRTSFAAAKTLLDATRRYQTEQPHVPPKNLLSFTKILYLRQRHIDFVVFLWVHEAPRVVDRNQK
jgi:hypothetical protein